MVDYTVGPVAYFFSARKVLTKINKTRCTVLTTGWWWRLVVISMEVHRLFSLSHGTYTVLVKVCFPFFRVLVFHFRGCELGVTGTNGTDYESVQKLGER
mmetsp:Transcript_26345/g.40265  ORF Transcript_26345/g.40265 Transcript_26345/m.40265 type:complete len:99 (-) Transcript_26345:242-538(-)